MLLGATPAPRGAVPLQWLGLQDHPRDSLELLDRVCKKVSRSWPKTFSTHGDNLEILRLHIKDETIDLVYLDPALQNTTSVPLSSNGTRSDGSPGQSVGADSPGTVELERVRILC